MTTATTNVWQGLKEKDRDLLAEGLLLIGVAGLDFENIVTRHDFTVALYDFVNSIGMPGVPVNDDVRPPSTQYDDSTPLYQRLDAEGSSGATIRRVMTGLALLPLVVDSYDKAAARSLVERLHDFVAGSLGVPSSRGASQVA